VDLPPVRMVPTPKSRVHSRGSDLDIRSRFVAIVFACPAGHVLQTHKRHIPDSRLWVPLTLFCMIFYLSSRRSYFFE